MFVAMNRNFLYYILGHAISKKEQSIYYILTDRLN